MRKDLILLSKIFALSVVVYQTGLGKTKVQPDASDAETHAHNHYSVDEKIQEEMEE